MMAVWLPTLSLYRCADCHALACLSIDTLALQERFLLRNWLRLCTRRAALMARATPWHMLLVIQADTFHRTVLTAAP